MSKSATITQLPTEATGKLCKACGKFKAWEEYHKDRSHTDGHRSSCRLCKAEGDRLYKLRKQGKNDLVLAEKRAQKRALDEKSTANRNAMLRLIHNHRTEFEAYVNAETLLFQERQKKGASPEEPASRNIWVTPY